MSGCPICMQTSEPQWPPRFNLRRTTTPVESRLFFQLLKYLRYGATDMAPPTLQRALRRSDRDLPAYFDDAVAWKAEEIADMHGVSLHRGEKRLLPFSQTLPVGPVNDRFAGDVIGDVVGIEAATLLARLSQKLRNVRPFHESIAGRHAPEIRRNLDRHQALGRLDPRDGLDHNPENEQMIVQ